MDVQRLLNCAEPSDRISQSEYRRGPRYSMLCQYQRAFWVKAVYEIDARNEEPARTSAFAHSFDGISRLILSPPRAQENGRSLSTIKCGERVEFFQNVLDLS